MNRTYGSIRHSIHFLFEDEYLVVTLEESNDSSPEAGWKIIRLQQNPYHVS